VSVWLWKAIRRSRTMACREQRAVLNARLRESALRVSHTRLGSSVNRYGLTEDRHWVRIAGVEHFPAHCSLKLNVGAGPTGHLAGGGQPAPVLEATRPDGPLSDGCVHGWNFERDQVAVGGPC